MVIVDTDRLTGKAIFYSKIYSHVLKYTKQNKNKIKIKIKSAG